MSMKGGAMGMRRVHGHEGGSLGMKGEVPGLEGGVHGHEGGGSMGMRGRVHRHEGVGPWA